MKSLEEINAANQAAGCSPPTSAPTPSSLATLLAQVIDAQLQMTGAIGTLAQSVAHLAQSTNDLAVSALSVESDDDDDDEPPAVGLDGLPIHRRGGAR